MATPVTADECAAALESMLGDLYGGAEVEARIAADLLRSQAAELTTLRAAVEALRNDAAQFAGDNERLLKALNRETVEEALTAIASLIAAVVAGRAYFNDDSVEIGRALLAALRSCHGAIPPLPPSADGDVMFPATETPRDGAGEG